MDAHEQFEAAVQIAENYWSAGNLKRAYQAYQTILKERTLSKDGSDFAAADLVVMERTADLAILFNQGDAADGLFSTIISASETAGNFFAADYARLKRMHLALQHSRFDEAYRVLHDMNARIGQIDELRFTNSSLSAWEDTCQWPGSSPLDRVLLFAQIYWGMGTLLAMLGQYVDSVAAYRRGLVHCQPNSINLAQQYEIPLKLGLARALMEFGDLSESAELLHGLDESMDEKRAPGFFVQWAELLGRLALLRGEFGSALAQFERIHEFCHTNHLEIAKVRALLNLAYVLIYLNHTNQALELLSGVEHHPHLKVTPALTVRRIFLTRMAQLRASSLTDSIPLASSVTQLWENTPKRDRSSADSNLQSLLDLPQADNYLSFFDERCLELYWLVGQNNLEQASLYLQNLRAVFSLSDSRIIQTRLETLAGVLFYYQGNPQKAQPVLQQCLEKFQELGLKPEQWQVLRFLGWCASRLGQPEQQQQITSSADHLLAELTNSLEPQDQVIFLINKWTEEEKWIAEEINLLASMKLKFINSSWWIKPLRWWQMAARLNQFANRVEQYKNIRAWKSVRGDSAQARAPKRLGLIQRLVRQSPDQVTLSFLVLPDRVFIMRSGWLMLDFGVSPMTRLALRDLVRAWHQHYAWSFSSGRQLHFAGKVSAQDQFEGLLAKQIVSQLADGLQVTDFLSTLPARIRKLSIVPDDSLHGFPFAVLPCGEGFLIERFSIRIVFHQDFRRSGPRPGNRALLVGISRGGGEFSSLPGVEKELNLIQKQFSNMRAQIIRLENQSATKQSLLEQLPNSSYFHIACHGIFEQTAPDRSGLVLNPASTPTEILSLRELSRLDLSNIKHATLSSCWSADSFVFPGRWVIGLPETLERAGIQSILGALWAVNDEVAAQFMNRFYSLLSEYERDDALRQVQLECLRGTLLGAEKYDLTSPVYWAAFNLYGDDSRLKT